MNKNCLCSPPSNGVPTLRDNPLFHKLFLQMERNNYQQLINQTFNFLADESSQQTHVE